jgi:molecular chaperone DnaK
LAIDFGTSYTSMAYFTDDGPQMVMGDETPLTIPSVVWFRGRDDCVVGAEAREQMATDPNSVVHSVKRLLGCTIDDHAAQPTLNSLACTSRPGPNRSIVFDFHGTEQTPITIAATIMRHAKAAAEAHLEQAVKKAVLAFPVSFGRHHQTAIKRAARIAGIDVVDLIPEPVAAALAFFHTQSHEGMVGVYDFGGGTFDFCLGEVDGDHMNIVGARGDMWLGGDDFDHVVANYAADQFWKQSKIDLRKRSAEWQRLLHASEEAKMSLSLVDETEIYVPEVAHTADGELDLEIPVNRSTFEQLTAEIVQNSLAVCEEAMMEAEINVLEITDLVLTGGTTRIPAVKNAAESFFARQARVGLHPEFAVALGAAMHAAAL